jgi:hypothetical protein
MSMLPSTLMYATWSQRSSSAAACAWTKPRWFSLLQCLSKLEREFKLTITGFENAEI